MIEVELIDHMGTDASVVNAARVIFGKRIKEMSEGDTKLIRYLAKHNHWSPLVIVQYSFISRHLYSLHDS